MMVFGYERGQCRGDTFVTRVGMNMEVALEHMRNCVPLDEDQRDEYLRNLDLDDFKIGKLLYWLIFGNKEFVLDEATTLEERITLVDSLTSFGMEFEESNVGIGHGKQEAIDAYNKLTSAEDDGLWAVYE